MKKIKPFFALIILSSIIVFCEKDSSNFYWKTMNEAGCRCINSYFPSCTLSDKATINFFKGKINGYEVCFAEGFEGYKFISSSVQSATLPVNQEFDPNKSDESRFGFSLLPPFDYDDNISITDLLPHFLLYTPGLTGNTTSGHVILDSFLRKDINLPLSVKGLISDGWVFQLVYYCRLNAEEISKLVSNNENYIPAGVQVVIAPAEINSNNYHFKLIELNKETSSDFYTYNLTFEIECDLLQVGSNKPFGRLENGVFKTAFILPRDE